MIQVAIEIDMTQLGFLGDMTPKVQTALIRALNRTAERSRTEASRKIREEINFPASYLSGNKLEVRARARGDSLEAIVSAPYRATSLARFTDSKYIPPSQRTGREKPVRTTVAKGAAPTTWDRGFLVSLGGNIAFAVRTDGPAPAGAYKPKELDKGLWLLYGPSVGQALIDATGSGGIYDRITPEQLDFLEREFNRQMDLLDA